MSERRRSSVKEAFATAGLAAEQATVTDNSFLKRANDKATFATDESNEEYYKPIDTYEGRHRYDPKFEWTEKEERRIVRKIDWRICTFVGFWS